MLRRSSACCVLLVLLARCLGAQADPTDDFITAELQRQRIPGLSLVVIKNGAIVKTGAYGVANIALKKPTASETVYKIASVSKQFIATGVMLLAQDGRLRVEDFIEKYLDGTPAAWKPITIRHLLTHTAGLVREAPGFSPSKIQSDADVVKSAYGVPLKFAPGEKWDYSNVGYFALAEIITRIAGKPWPDFLAERVFKPSGMNSTFPTNTRASVPNRATGYTDNDALRPADDWLALRPSGAFLSTVLDMARWDAMLDTDRILTASTRREMWTPVTLRGGTTHPYGFGWQIDAVNGRKRVHHSGGMTGFRANFSRFLDDRLTIVVLMNLDDVDIDAIVHGLARIHLPASSPAAQAVAPFPSLHR